ncbi:MAG: (2Fe-2S) ferredoxin domain-containing protein, partial [Negativicutes bacterium]|nr:(2Fe-2S) ferredoxin domain-containing protein [Negativicutes bacterium]
MKTIEDLKKMREKFQAETKLRHAGGIQVIVGMGTCGIAAGAREVMSAILDEIAKRKLQDVTVRQT